MCACVWARLSRRTVGVSQRGRQSTVLSSARTEGWVTVTPLLMGLGLWEVLVTGIEEYGMWYLWFKQLELIKLHGLPGESCHNQHVHCAPFLLGSCKGGRSHMRVSSQSRKRQVMRRHLWPFILIFWILCCECLTWAAEKHWDQEYQSDAFPLHSYCYILLYVFFLLFNSGLSLLLTSLPSPGFLQPPVVIWPAL